MKILSKIPIVEAMILSVAFMQPQRACAQNNQETLKPRVSFYQGYSSAVADTGYPTFAIQFCSHYLFGAIENDTATYHVELISFANAGSDSLDSVIAGGWAPLPDTGKMYGADYYISSNLSGSAGNYTLNVYLKDANTRSIVATGSATFSTADTASVKTAASQAASGVLPLITRIAAYQTQVRNAGPDLSIDPQINITLPNLLAGTNQNLNVTIQTVDFDGHALKNRHVKLTSSKGSFASSDVQTDASGQANVAYNTGSGNGVAVISASMDSSLTVTGDTLSVQKQSYLIVGSVPLVDSTQYYTDTIYELDFDVRVKVAGFTDKSETDATMVGWSQANWAEVYSAHGSVPGHGLYSPLANNFTFNADTGAVWGKMFKTKSQHDLAMYNVEPCWDYDLMEAWTYNGKVDQAELLKNSPAYLSYSPSASPGQRYEFSYTVPFIYRGSDDSWGEASGNVDSHGNCQRGDAGSSVYSVNQSHTISADVHDSDPGISVVKSGDGYLISYTNVDVTEDTTTSLTGYQYQVITTNYNGTLKPIRQITSIHGQSASTRPLKFELAQNYPDPFNPTTVINYQLPMISNVTLKVYDVLGREVRTLVSDRQNPGSYSVTFNASGLASGIYFYKLDTGNYTYTKKMIVLK